MGRGRGPQLIVQVKCRVWCPTDLGSDPSSATNQLCGPSQLPDVNYKQNRFDNTCFTQLLGGLNELRGKK